jgi:hypothetical protein
MVSANKMWTSARSDIIVAATSIAKEIKLWDKKRSNLGSDHGDAGYRIMFSIENKDSCNANQWLTSEPCY